MTDIAICDVLIVEDDLYQSEEMAASLSRTGLTVRTAHDGNNALRLLVTSRPRVILLDYNLPDTTGDQLAGKLKALVPEAAIIMMSGGIDGISEQTLRAAGITVFVNKPVPLEALRRAVLKLVCAKPANIPAPIAQNGWLSTGFGGTRHGSAARQYGQ